MVVTPLLVNTVAKYWLNRFAILSGLSEGVLGIGGEVTESRATPVAVEIRSGTLFDFEVCFSTDQKRFGLSF